MRLFYYKCLLIFLKYITEIIFSFCRVKSCLACLTQEYNNFFNLQAILCLGKDVKHQVLLSFGQREERIDDRGNIILLKQQDRSLWYRPLIKKGYQYLEAATGEENSVWHMEAAIAYFHAVALSFETTDWHAIYYLYNVLYEKHPTPFIALNKAIAGLYAKDAATALKELKDITELEHYYLYHTAVGEVYFADNNRVGR